MERLAAATERHVRLLEREEARLEGPGPRRRRDPEQVNLSLFLQSVPGLAEQFKTVVPAEFWQQMKDDLAAISCPCGESPDLPPGRVVECQCNRFYLWTGPQVRVAKYDSCAVD